ncbi:uncharacterized protein CEXT_470441 [Caerostris extrusa]|uniref:RRM domain-containing protein n=1 Tax=Caerostris extrusa TaxID=172846 RepID=A0AAV4XA14_CAEEX|nr:uncharacterized protein CEXT_470441 [Caerostris extrusa]
MAYYYKIGDNGNEDLPSLEGVQIHAENSSNILGPCIDYDFSKHVLIELLDNVTPETKLWVELGLANDKNITHKRMLLDPHRINCRRAVVVCINSEKAKELAQRLSQAQIMKRSVCAVVIQELLSDISLFEKQIMKYGDKRSQCQLVYVTELTRCHEPNGLTHYLREKFSPFGTILSVFVSEDKDGYAYPEGVIRFAYLSEAFAAELAYDQCAIAMERLSVTTHHNILLAQCDLRARLREVRKRQSNEFNSFETSENHLMDAVNKLNFCETKMLDEHCAMTNIKGKSLTENDDTDKIKEQTVVISHLENDNACESDSAEIADTLKNSCESNFMNCLESIAMCNESSVLQKVSDESAVSLCNDKQDDINQSTLPLSVNDLTVSSLPAEKKLWSSRILGWITDISSTDSSILENKDLHENNLASESSTANNKIEHVNSIQQTKILNSVDVLSNKSSFVTCGDNDQNSSFKSISSETSRDSLIVNKTFYSESPKEQDNISDAAASDINVSHNTIDASKTMSDKSPNSYLCSSKRKTSLSLSECSVKIKRMNFQSNSEILANDITLPTGGLTFNELLPYDKLSVISVNSASGLNVNTENLIRTIHLKEPRINLKRLTVSEIQSAQKAPFQASTSKPKSRFSKNRRGKIINISKDNFLNKSQLCRRSSRLQSQESDADSHSVCSIPSKNHNYKKKSSSSINLTNNINYLANKTKTDSPLKIWLKKELDISTNNKIFKNQGTTKSIICATANKDVLISVGCSHMTCDFCYPDSTKLLLGFQ